MSGAADGGWAATDSTTSSTCSGACVRACVCVCVCVCARARVYYYRLYALVCMHCFYVFDCLLHTLWVVCTIVYMLCVYMASLRCYCVRTIHRWHHGLEAAPRGICRIAMLSCVLSMLSCIAMLSCVPPPPKFSHALVCISSACPLHSPRREPVLLARQGPASAQCSLCAWMGGRARRRCPGDHGGSLRSLWYGDSL